ncbi:MAG: C40 family peptidase [Lachnospiraceae bacterium]|nr:C40 family peptidase [Lachnospiraceae bacterium]
MNQFKKTTTLKRLWISLLAVCLVLSTFPARAEETLPIVGTPTDYFIGPEDSTEPAVPEEPTEVNSETEDSSEIQDVQEETTKAPEEPAGEVDLSQVYDYLKLKEQQSGGQQVVNVINEHTDRDENRTAAYEEELLRSMRLRKQAELSELNIIVFRSSGFVNVRKEPSAAAAAVGLMRYNSTAEVLESLYEEDGLWYHIQSGEVNGYVKAEFFESGAEAAEIISTIVRCYAVMNYDAQRLLREQSEYSDTMAVLYSGQKYQVDSWNDSYVRILYASGESGTFYGYVPVSAVKLSWETSTAVTMEMEQRSLEEANRIQYELSSIDRSREESRMESIRASESESYEAYLQASIAASLEAVAEASRAEASRQASIAESIRQSEAARQAWEESSRQASIEASRWLETSTQYEAPTQPAWGDYTRYIPEGTSDFRRRVVTNALQYVDKLDYVFGGYSLSYGTDCSGFLSLIYAQYGIELAHYSYYIAYTGVKVISIDQARPGDIVCWRTWDPGAGAGHVAMYIGRNEAGQPMIVEAPREGLKVRVIVMPTEGLHTIQNVIGD